MPSDPETQRVRVRRRALQQAEGQRRSSGPHLYSRRFVTCRPIASNNRTCSFRPVVLLSTSMPASFRCGHP